MLNSNYLYLYLWLFIELPAFVGTPCECIRLVRLQIDLYTLLKLK